MWWTCALALSTVACTTEPDTSDTFAGGDVVAADAAPTTLADEQLIREIESRIEGGFGRYRGHLVRLASEVCSPPRARTDEQRATGGPCRSDLDCDGPYGYCDPHSYYFCGSTSQCKRGCTSDADCNVDELCLCGLEFNECVPADCRSDSDCEGEARCLSYAGFEGGCSDDPRWTRFSCQRPADECTVDDDCDFDSGSGFCEGESDGARRCNEVTCTDRYC